MGCELCGKKETLCTAMIENTRMQVCKDCAAYGKVLQAPPEVRRKQGIVKEEEVVPEIVEDYASLIRQAREKKKMTQEELAKALNEKESIVHKLETGNFEPDIKLAQKLEKYLHITLIEKEQAPTEIPTTRVKGEGFTLADFIKKKK